MAESTKISTWTDFLFAPNDKEQKLAALKHNRKLLFSNPGPLRKRFISSILNS